MTLSYKYCASMQARAYILPYFTNTTSRAARWNYLKMCTTLNSQMTLFNFTNVYHIKDGKVTLFTNLYHIKGSKMALFTHFQDDIIYTFSRWHYLQIRHQLTYRSHVQWALPNRRERQMGTDTLVHSTPSPPCQLLVPHRPALAWETPKESLRRTLETFWRLNRSLSQHVCGRSLSSACSRPRGGGVVFSPSWNRGLQALPGRRPHPHQFWIPGQPWQYLQATNLPRYRTSALCACQTLAPPPPGRNECDAALWGNANEVFHRLVVLVVRVRLHLVSCSARSLREQLEAIENDHDLALIGSPETHGHRLPELLSVWPTDQEGKFHIQYVKCCMEWSMHGRQGDVELIGDVLEEVVHAQANKT